MPEKLKITAIGKKSKGGIVVLSDSMEIFLSRDVIKRYDLKKGFELSRERLNKIKFESDLTRADDYAAYLLSRREYSIGMLKNKIICKGFNNDVAGYVISKFKKADLIDDNRFARQVVESMLRHRPAGRAFLVAYLRKKYISRNLAEAVVDELLEDIDENELALRVLRSRWRQYRKFDLETARRKAYNYLSRRAISYGAARFAFDKITEEERED